MKKILVFIFVFLVFGLDVKSFDYKTFNNANDSSNKLIYNIENVSINSHTITFEGWAIVNREHTLGGQNYKISIVAYNEDDFKNASSLSSLSRKIRITENKYEGENGLYPSLCIKTNSVCDQVYFGFYDNVMSRTGTGGRTVASELKNGAEYATCIDSDKGDCMSYNPKFKISFDISSLKNTLGDNIVFVIEIDYESIDIVASDSGSGCRYTSSHKYEGCVRNNLSKHLKRVLAFDESVKKTAGGDLGLIVTPKFETVFVNMTDYGGLYEWNAAQNKFQWYEGWGASDLTVFEVRPGENVYHITDSKYYSSATGGTGISTNIRWYNLLLSGGDESESRGGYRYFKPCSTKGGCFGVEPREKYIPASWGIVDGYVSLQIVAPPSPPINSCTEFGNKTGCDIDYTRNCDVSFSHSLNNVLEMSTITSRLNDAGCYEQASVDVKRVYNITENYKLNIVNILNTSKPWPRLALDNNYEFTLYRTINGFGASAYFDDYYDIKRYYMDSNGICKSETGYATKDYLIRKGFTNAEINNFSLDLSLINNKDNFEYKYKIPNSNRSGSFYTSGVMNDVDKSINNLTFSLKNTYLKRNQWKVEYSSSALNSNDYISLENKYVIPFYVKKGENLKFINEFNNVGLYNFGYALNLKSECNLLIDDGNLETMKYRVIDINKPFPNRVPELGVNASNWYNLWNSNNNILVDRYKDIGLEYQLELKPSDIKNIRDYNKNLYNGGVVDTKYLYTNADILNDGKSDFIDDYLTIPRKYNYYKLGEGYVE